MIIIDPIIQGRDPVSVGASLYKILSGSIPDGALDHVVYQMALDLNTPPATISLSFHD